MELKSFAIYDVKAALYLQPMFFRRRQEAERSFALAANNPESDFFKYAEDYSLFELGTYDEASGIMTSLVAPLLVVNAVQASVRHRDCYASYQLLEKGALAS